MIYVILKYTRKSY